MARRGLKGCRSIAADRARRALPQQSQSSGTNAWFWLGCSRAQIQRFRGGSITRRHQGTEDWRDIRALRRPSRYVVACGASSFIKVVGVHVAVAVHVKVNDNVNDHAPCSLT
jgi:hypothetical protein